MKTWERCYVGFLVKNSSVLEELPNGYAVYVKYFSGDF